MDWPHVAILLPQLSGRRLQPVAVGCERRSRPDLLSWRPTASAPPATARPNRTPIPSGAKGTSGEATGAFGAGFTGVTFGGGRASPMTLGGFTVDQLESGGNG